MRFFVPVAPEAAVRSHHELRVPSEQIRRVGIIDDAMDPPLMAAIARHLGEAFPQGHIDIWTKPIRTAPAPEDIVTEVAKKVDVALTGVGM